MLQIRTVEDLDRLIKDQVMENLTLDYKQSLDLQRDEKKKEKLCVEITSFANSAGGQVVYGIKEDKHYPVEIDEGADVSKEWIEQVIDSNVQPRIEGLIVHPIKLSKGWGYCVDIPPATTRAPHQAPDGRYYKRQNFQSVRMEDYEIRDVLKRSTTPDLDVQLTFEHGRNTCEPQFSDRNVSNPFMLVIRTVNRSSQPAFHAFIEVLIGTILPAAFPTTSFPSVGEENGLRVHRMIVQSPPNVPIFKEGDPVNHQGSIALTITRRLQYSDGATIPLKTRVQTPGFSAEQDWKILCAGSVLQLVKA
jgi:hypothetical protein